MSDPLTTAARIAEAGADIAEAVAPSDVESLLRRAERLDRLAVRFARRSVRLMGQGRRRERAVTSARSLRLHDLATHYRAEAAALRARLGEVDDD